MGQLLKPPTSCTQSEVACCQLRRDSEKTKECCAAEQYIQSIAASEPYRQSAAATVPQEALVIGREPTLPTDFSDLGQEKPATATFDHRDEKTTALPRNEKRHLVINMDINKTIIMSDKVSQKTVDMVANEVMSNCAWGTVVDGGDWVLINREPTYLRPAPGMLSYAEWLEQQLPGSEHKKKRTTLNGTFTYQDQPGKAFAGYAKRMCDVLKRPDGSNVRIIPAFFELLQSLKRQRRSFTLCFRTFGADLDDVAEEMNSFCEGRHPYYPGVRMDGSDGEPDYRFNVSDKNTCGTFHRENDCVSLVMGTQEQPGEGKYRDAKDKSIGFYKDWPDVQIVSGFEAVSNFLWYRCSRSGTLGLRDYFAFWKEKKMTSEGGKMFFFNLQQRSNRHEVFFDDNITYDEGYIVQPINIDLPSVKPVVAHLIQSHLCRAEPIMSIVDEKYFCAELERLEQAYTRKLQLRSRMGQAMRKVLRFGDGTFKERCKRLSEISRISSSQSDYDPWRGSRQLDRRLSITTADAVEARAF